MIRNIATGAARRQSAVFIGSPFRTPRETGQDTMGSERMQDYSCAHCVAGLGYSVAKRSLQINVRLAPDDLKAMRQAAERIWPGMPLTNSTLLLTLAKQKADEILQKKKS